MSKKLSYLVRLAVTAAIAFALFKFVPYEQLLKTYERSTKVYIFIGILVFTFATFCAVARWKFLLSVLKVRISWREACYSSFSSYFFNLFFPSCVAGDVFRGFSISYRHGNTKKVASSVLMDRFSGLIALSLIALFSYIIGKDLLPHGEVLLALGILFCGVIFSFSIIFSRTFFNFFTGMLKKNSAFKQKLVSFHDQLYFFKENPSLFIKSLLLSLPMQAAMPLSFFVISKAFGIEVGLIYFFILVPIIMLISFIPVTIAGAGTREAAAVYFFSLAGMDKEVGLGISLVNLAFLIFMGIAGGVLYLAVYHRWVHARQQKQPC